MLHLNSKHKGHAEHECYSMIQFLFDFDNQIVQNQAWMDTHVCIVKVLLTLDWDAKLLQWLEPALDRAKKMLRMNMDLDIC